MKRYCNIVFILALCAAALPGLAQSSGDDGPASREDVVTLFNVMKVHDQVRAVMDSVAKQQRTMVHDMILKKFPETTEEESKRFDSFIADLMKDFPMDAMLDDMIPVYQKHLSHGDVVAMTAFYSSPAGQKVLHELPAMTAESMQAMGPRLQTTIDNMSKRLEQMANEEQEKKAAPKPKS